jgi:hypothetical protein
VRRGMMTDEQGQPPKGAVEEARGKSSEELVEWAFQRRTNDSFRQALVTLEFQRRVTVAAQETTVAAQETAKSTRDSARYMRLSVYAITAAAVITAAATIFSAWWATYHSACP